METKFNFFLKTIIVIAVLGLSFLLRYKNFAQVPVAGISVDEYSYSWVGLSLITDHYPVGISEISGYKNNDERYVNPDNLLHFSVSGPFVFNYPWFDHPPLLGLITGGYSYFKGVRNFEDVKLHIIRQPMVVLGTMGVFLLFVFGYINFGYLPALVAMLIYGTSPLSVVGSRMVQGENGMVIPYLLSLIFISLYLKKGRTFWLFLAAIFVGLSVLFKLSGVVALLSASILIAFSNSKNRREKAIDILTLGVVFLLFVSLFVVYGLYFDWEVFKNIIVTNSNRYYGIGPNALFNLITESKLTGGKNIFDGWILVGWICTFLNMSRTNRRKMFLAVPIVSYLIIYLLFGSHNNGWYMFPFLPFLALNAGYRLIKIVKDGKVVAGVLLGLLVIGNGVTAIVNVENFQRYSGLWRIGVPLGIAFSLFVDHNRGVLTRIGKYLVILLFLTGIALNILFLKNLDATSWYANVW